MNLLSFLGGIGLPGTTLTNINNHQLEQALRQQQFSSDAFNYPTTFDTHVRSPNQWPKPQFVDSAPDSEKDWLRRRVREIMWRPS